MILEKLHKCCYANDICTQYWRVFTHYFTCTNSSDLVLTELVLFNEGITVERSFGSLKFSVGLNDTRLHKRTNMMCGVVYYRQLAHSNDHDMPFAVDTTFPDSAGISFQLHTIWAVCSATEHLLPVLAYRPYGLPIQNFWRWIH